MDRSGRYRDARMLGQHVRAAELPDGQCEVVSPFDSKSAILPGDVATALIAGTLPEKVVKATLEGLLPVRDPAVAEKYEDWTKQLREQFSDGPAVLFDRTTVANALQAVTEPSLVTPLRLLDLSLLTYAALTADHVVLHPSNATRSLAAQYPDLFCLPASPSDRFEEDLLRSSNISVRNVISSSTPSLEAAWRTFLTAGQGGADWIRLDPEGFDRHWDSPQQWDDVLAVDHQESVLAQCLAGIMPPDEHSRRSANLFISVQTYRAFRNFGVAGLLGIPYYGSVLRLPAYEHGIRSWEVRARAIERILSHAAQLEPPERSLGVIRLKAPLPLQMVLSRMREPGDYFDVLADLREEFKELRRDVHQRLVEGGNPESIAGDYQRMLNELSSTAAAIGPTITFAAVAVAIPFVFLAASIALGADQIAVALGALCSIPSFQEALARLAARASNRYLTPLLALGEQAASISTLADEVRRIWRTEWSDYNDAVLDGAARRANQLAFRGAA